MSGTREPITALTKFDEIFSSYTDRTNEIRHGMTWPILETRGKMEISSFCTVEMKNADPDEDTRNYDRRFLQVKVPPAVLDKVFQSTVCIEYDQMYWQVIDWGNGKSLVTCSHNKIIGSVWLAVIETSSIPRTA